MQNDIEYIGIFKEKEPKNKIILPFVFQDGGCS